MLIKICGLSRAENVDAALDGGATHVGFIFFEKSPRHVAPELAGELARRARGRARTVAVTVDADDGSIAHIGSKMHPDMLQLHGSETPERAEKLRLRFGLPLIKALSIREVSDLERLDAYSGVVEFLLLDAKPPVGAQLPGGNGVAFDWSLLSGIDPAIPYMLSGGINIDNVDKALSLSGPIGIDLSSGVESAPGLKDNAMISALLERVHAIERSAA